MEEERVGERLAAFRTRAGLSQSALAASVSLLGGHGWTQTTVSSLERGERVLRVSELESVVIALGTTVQEFVIWGDEETAAMAENVRALRESHFRLCQALLKFVEAHMRFDEIPESARSSGEKNRSLELGMAQSCTVRRAAEAVASDLNRRDRSGDKPWSPDDILSM